MTEVISHAARQPFPPKVAAAITQVMKAVPKLGKGEKNQHAGYQFASIDTFLEVVGRLCAEAGLFIVQDEESFEVVPATDKNGKAAPWLKIVYRFTLAHSSGETWEHCPARTIMVQANMGSQAFGAAQSYALKQFERSLFQIATGENEDADSHPQTDLPGAQRKAPTPAQTAPQANPDDLQKTDFNNAMKAFERERIGLLMALKNNEISAEEADSRYREIRSGTLLFKTDNAEKQVKVGALLKQCMRSTIWKDDTKADFKGFETRLKETREELDAAKVASEDNPFAMEAAQ